MGLVFFLHFTCLQAQLFTFKLFKLFPQESEGMKFNKDLAFWWRYSSLLPFTIFSNFSHLGNAVLGHSAHMHQVICCTFLLWYLSTLYFTGSSGIALKTVWVCRPLSSFLWYQNTPDLQSFWWFYSLEAGGNIIHPAQTGNWSTRQLKWFSWRKEVCDCSIRNWIHFFLIPVWSPSPDNPSYAKCSRIRSVIRQQDVCANDALVTQAWALHSETLEQKADLWNLQQRNEAIGKKPGLNTLWVQHESGQDPALENITQYDFEQRLLMRPRVNWEDRVCVQESRPRAIYT